MWKHGSPHNPFYASCNAAWIFGLYWISANYTLLLSTADSLSCKVGSLNLYRRSLCHHSGRIFYGPAPLKPPCAVRQMEQCHCFFPVHGWNTAERWRRPATSWLSPPPDAKCCSRTLTLASVIVKLICRATPSPHYSCMGCLALHRCRVHSENRCLAFQRMKRDVLWPLTDLSDLILELKHWFKVWWLYL